MTISLDLESFLLTSTAVLVFFGLYTLWTGRARMQQAGELPYHRLRQQRLLQGWATVFWGLVLFALAALLHWFGRPVVYSVFPVTPTSSQTSTPTLSPTPSLSPTLTLTPSETPTLQFTYTPSPTLPPQLPDEVRSQFTSVVTPNPAAVFSPLTFSRDLNFRTYTAIEPGTLFESPVEGIYATFSYDGMLPDSQWSALWYRQGQLVHFETMPWDGGTGGFGYTEWLAPSQEWLPGIYQVQIFVGDQPKVVGEFEVSGPAGTPTPPAGTLTPTP
ncbi:MAG: hypothetical protein KIT46_08585 [Anaerolineales bacterium]|nr:hypothetical protein [Anaerolineales bacterium]MCW5856087.1 hypothetical protein [Anaerolineales bacterium]